MSRLAGSNGSKDEKIDANPSVCTSARALICAGLLKGEGLHIVPARRVKLIEGRRWMQTLPSHIAPLHENSTWPRSFIFWCSLDPYPPPLPPHSSFLNPYSFIYLLLRYRALLSLPFSSTKAVWLRCDLAHLTHISVFLFHRLLLLLLHLDDGRRRHELVDEHRHAHLRETECVCVCVCMRALACKQDDDEENET